MPVRVLNVRRYARSAGGGVIVASVRAVGGRTLAVAEGQGCEYRHDMWCASAPSPACHQSCQTRINSQTQFQQHAGQRMTSKTVQNSSLVQFRAHRGLQGRHIGGHIGCFYNV
jgi:hypothetical protein